jgi:hypothetical protein
MIGERQLGPIKKDIGKKGVSSSRRASAARVESERLFTGGNIDIFVKDLKTDEMEWLQQRARSA